jgi:hypothetical protein
MPISLRRNATGSETAECEAANVWAASSCPTWGWPVKKAIDLVGWVFGRLKLGTVERATQMLRCLSAPKTCTCPQAAQDFVALGRGSLEVEGLLRLARHTSQCISCRDLLTTLVMAAGLRRVVRAGLQDLIPDFPKRGQS